MKCKKGCLDESTMIRMTDGSQKRIGQVTIGDLVFTEGEYYNRVANIWRGQNFVIKISTKDEGKILLTENHPIKVNNNWKRAKDIKVGDELHSTKDVCDRRVCAVEKISEYVMVYNLDLECDNDGMYANNFLVGDFKKQQRRF